MTRAGSKLVLRTSPAPGHYLCIKWDFASLPLRAAALRVYLFVTEGLAISTHIIGAHINQTSEWCIQRLVVETVDVERGSALVVGGDNVLLDFNTSSIANNGYTKCLNGVLSQWFVSQFGKIDGHI
jgi:hypothetical protein